MALIRPQNYRPRSTKWISRLFIVIVVLLGITTVVKARIESIRQEREMEQQEAESYKRRLEGFEADYKFYAWLAEQAPEHYAKLQAEEKAREEAKRTCNCCRK